MERYLEFQLDSKYFKAPSAKSIQMIAWKPNRLSEESIKSPTTSKDSLTPLFSMLPKLKRNFIEVARNQKKKNSHHKNNIPSSSLQDRSEFCKNIIIFGVCNISSVHADNIKKGILVLGNRWIR